MPYSAITDGTRWQIKPNSFSSLDEALRQTASIYRKALWDDQPTYVEVWLEKDALSGVVAPITDRTTMCRSWWRAGFRR